MRSLGHLRHLLRGQDFRRLFAVRVASQFTDGVFQVAVASYVIFSPERQATPGAIAAALAAVLLPFSVLGPFAGVLLDRWSRRQVLAMSNFSRVGIVLVLAAVVAAGLGGPLLFGLILLALSVNRFLLAGLSASLPHVVDADDLVTANAVTPTCGTLAAILGLSAGTLGEVLLERSERLGGPALDGDVGVLAVAAVLYGVAGLLALRIPRDLLGPDRDVGPGGQLRLGSDLRAVVRGLVDGLRHLRSRRSAALGLGVIAAHRFCYGISTVMVVVLYRSTFYPADDPDAAFRGLAAATLVGGAGYVSAALVTPAATERIGIRAWVLALLVGAAFTQVLPGALFTEPAVLVSSYVLGLASQGIKICVDTLVQAGVDDAFRGRVFSLYDVIFNVAFVAAAAVAALVLPPDGRSYAVLGAIALGYLASAVGYTLATRPTRPTGVAGRTTGRVTRR